MMNKEIVLLISIAVFSSIAQADSGFYFGAKPGIMESSRNQFDSTSTIGFTVGRHFSDRFAIESEITKTAPDGVLRNSSVDRISPLENGEWENTTLAAYAVGRWGRKLYFKGRVGLLYEDVKVTYSSGEANNATDVGTSIGFGGGYQFSKNYNLEFESTTVDQDLSILSLSLNARF